jgi:hypothetical protein
MTQILLNCSKSIFFRSPKSITIYTVTRCLRFDTTDHDFAHIGYGCTSITSLKANILWEFPVNPGFNELAPNVKELTVFQLPAL